MEQGTHKEPTASTNGQPKITPEMEIIIQEEVRRLMSASFIAPTGDGNISFEGAANSTLMESTVRSLAAAVEKSSSALAESLVKVEPCVPPNAPPNISKQAFAEWRLQIMAATKTMTSSGSAGHYAFMRNSAGHQLRSLLDSLDLNSEIAKSMNPFEAAIDTLDEHFSRDGANIVDRLKLAKMTQKVDEGHVAFISRILEAAKWCGFEGKVIEFEVLLTIASGARDPYLKALAAEEGMKFTNVRRRAEAMDLTASIEDQKNVKPKANSSINEVRNNGSSSSRRRRYSSESTADSDEDHHKHPKKRREYKDQARSDYQRRDRYEPKNGNIGAPRGPVHCSCCGNTGHSFSSCYMKHESCRNCGRVGHLKRVCRQRTEVSSRSKRSENGAKNGKESKKGPPKKEGKVFNVSDDHEKDPGLKVRLSDSSDDGESQIAFQSKLQ